ncbi:DoxX family protein [Limimaricola pyoseonensis]|uniref:Putative oxidoreductase n=1 Tax=Limimaricola pyoseonensis TaxID=521013 RepID=A0A1G7FYQ5_9RHOB|nr:DoxX family protein [Limimaricola pyoseonensis]SDE80979.1 putative oxidoreductase [Limimaricola pyoseonensis]
MTEALTLRWMALTGGLDRAAAPVLGSLARLVFAAVLFLYYWRAGLAKIGEGPLGPFMPDPGAYAQIFPRAFEAVGYDPSGLGLFHWAVAVAALWAELVLPVLIVIGLATRLAALGMIGVVVVQSLTDILGHAVGPETVGAWFDRLPDAAILDQRAFWVFLLLALVLRGPGPISLDALIRRRLEPKPMRRRPSGGRPSPGRR